MTVSVGIVGAGAISKKMHLPVLLSMPDVRVDWLYDRDPARASELATAYRVPHAKAASAAELPHCDVLLLAIPVEARAEYLEIVARQGGSVFCEKPFALTAAEHRRVADLYPEYLLGCGYPRRFFDSMMTLRYVIAHQWFGPLQRVRIAEGNRSRASGVDTSFLDGAGAGSGVLTDLGSHSIDLALHLTGAQSFRILECDLVLDGQVDRRAHARVELREGVAGDRVELDYRVSWLDAQPNRMELEFERATVFCGLGWNAEVFVGDPRKPGHAFRLISPSQGARTPNQAFYLEWRAFLDGLVTRQESIVSANSAYLTTALVESLHEYGRRAYA